MTRTSSLAIQVRRVEAALHRELRPILDEHSLTMEHWRILAVVDDRPGLGMSEVAAAAVVAATSLTRHVDRLVERGLLVRRVDPDDRRRAVVALSPHGLAYVGRLRRAEQAARRQLGDTLPLATS
ncbi:MarR family transcriptional regulator [Nocardioides carbamazepini]|jgi:DNA-binding MarR family transcriptional regulator|uniref:MarR family winged helix-turn-helix transcriptional regulator n=1 Tax=Nocardioides carbamazepini TaxID=2854259 RepID=UPI002149A370|nr:MarR family transcriptional regulator [Nocardioides carbamazepini]MCR1780908.1 MarR family transcriptional regulator [Nocardioides carbamazepini]